MSNEFRGRNGVLSDGNLIVKQITTPDNPDEGYNKIYAKSDNKIYLLDDQGNEVELGSGAMGSLWYTDAGAPSDLIGVDNDLYLNETNSDVYQKVGGTWGTPICNIKGATGSQGATGATGANGSNGTNGKQVQMQSAGGYIQWKYDTDLTWTNLVELIDLKGDKGDTGSNIELQKSATHIQWKVVGDVSWIDLVLLADITGADGTDGQEVSMQVSGGYIQWRLGSGSWTNLILVSDLKGDAGTDGLDGNTWLSDTTTPSDLIGINGDFYLDETTYDVYKKETGTWGTALLNIKGATGAKGSTGEPGKTWYSSTGIPSDSLGIDGDFYLNETTYDVYKKAVGTWGTSLINIKGVGVVTGGTAHQALTKIDGTNFNTQWETIDKTFVGLANVDNTSDANKPISNAQTTVNKQNMAYLGNGILSGFNITINADTTKIDISTGVGYYVDNTTDPINPVFVKLNYAGQTAIALTNRTTHKVTYLAINSSGVLQQKITPFTMIERRDYILLGAAIHSNLSVVNAINNLPDVALDSGNQLNDFMDAIKNFNVSGNIFSANGSNLSINKSEGILFKKGVGFSISNKNPHTKLLDALVAPSTIRYRQANGTEQSDTNVIDLYWDSAGTRTAMSISKWYVQRINIFASNLVRIQYGQKEYNSESEAIQGISADMFTTEANIAENGLLRCFLVVKGNISDFSETTKFRFIESDKFGAVGGGTGSGTATMQQTYNNSETPEMTTDAIRGAVSFKEGTGIATNDVFEILNNSDAKVFSVTGEGNITGNNLSGINTGNETIVSTSAIDTSTTVKDEIADTDEIIYIDKVPTTPIKKKTTWSNFKSVLNTYFGSVYATIASVLGKKDFHGITSRLVTAPLPTHLTTQVYTLGTTAANTTYWRKGIKTIVNSDINTVLDDGTGATTTSGLLVSGKYYKITTFVAGDNFSNIATGVQGTVNTTGYIFLATGTTPTTWTNGSSVKELVGSAGLYFLYFSDDAGTIIVSKTFPGLDGDNVLFSEVFWNGTNYGIVYDERHNHTRNIDWHEWAHDTIRCRYRSGLGFSYTGNAISNTTFSIASGGISDEDIKFSIGTTTSARIWYQTSATTYTFDTALSTRPYRQDGTGINAINASTYAIIRITASNRWFNYWVFATPSNLSSIHIFCETTATVGGYTSEANARAVLPPSLDNFGLSPEYKLIYRIVVNGAGLLSVPVAADDYRTTSYITGSASPSTTASAVSNTPNGNITATTVQGAIDELDAEKASTAGASTTAAGLAPIATAPTTGLINLLGIAFGETVYSMKALFATTSPSTQAFGDTAVVGTGTTAARIDHKHAMMAAPTSVSGNAGTVTNGLYTTNKDASGGVPGLTLFKINIRNAANTFTNFFTNATTAARTWTFPDKDGTVAMTSDLSGSRTIANKTAAYVTANTDDLLICTANTFTITLYAASGNSGKQLEIKNDGTGVITIQANAAELIDGVNYMVLYQYDSAKLCCNGTKWHLL